MQLFAQKLEEENTPFKKWQVLSPYYGARHFTQDFMDIPSVNSHNTSMR